MVETQRQNLWQRTRHVMKTLFDSGAGTKGQAGGEPPDQTGLDMFDAYERVKGAVVQVRTPSGGGTGMVVADGRLILTNHHVVGSAPWVAIVSRDRSPRPARVLFGDRKLDLAILHVESPEPVRLRFAQHPARSATRVFAVGYPLGLSSNVTQGIISAVEPPSEMNGEVEWLRTDAAINPGNSGGPLLTVMGGSKAHCSHESRTLHPPYPGDRMER